MEALLGIAIVTIVLLVARAAWRGSREPGAPPFSSPRRQPPPVDPRDESNDGAFATGFILGRHVAHGHDDLGAMDDPANEDLSYDDRALSDSDDGWDLNDHQDDDLDG